MHVMNPSPIKPVNDKAVSRPTAITYATAEESYAAMAADEE